VTLFWGVADAIWGFSIKHLAERCGQSFEQKTICFLLHFFAINGEL
jgi:hypothetical protein